MNQVGKPGLRLRVQKVFSTISRLSLITILIVTVIYAWTLYESNLKIEDQLNKCNKLVDSLKQKSESLKEESRALSLSLGILSIVALLGFVTLMLINRGERTNFEKQLQERGETITMYQNLTDRISRGCAGPTQNWCLRKMDGI